MKLALKSLNDSCSKLNSVGVIFFLFLITVMPILPIFADSNLPNKHSVGQKKVGELITACNQLEDKDPAAAIKLGIDLLSELDKEEKNIDVGHVLGCLGWAYMNQNNLKEARTKALEIEHILLDLSVISADSIQLARRAGGIFHLMGDRISASENYNLAMQQAEELKIISEQIPILVNLGVLNSELRAHEQAINNYYQALDLMAKIEDFRYQPPVLYNLAVTLNGQQRFTEGLKFFQQVEAMINDQWPLGRVSQTYQGLAAAHSALDNLSLARNYAEKALSILNDNNQNDADFYNLKSVLANIYARQGDLELATQYADESSEFYLNPQNRSDILGSTNPLSGLAGTYERLGLLEQAIKMHKTSKDIEQEMQDTFNQEVMAQMQVRLNDNQEREALVLLKNERINNQIQLNAAEYKRQIWLLVSVAAIVIFLMFLYWQYLTNKKLKKMAMTDSLTQLGNRRATQNWLSAHSMPSEPGCRFLWLIDLDHFKAVNDEYDHDVGDLALQKISETLTGLNNDFRFVGRWGGEEFILITDDVGVNEKDGFSKLLLQAIQQTQIQTNSSCFSLTASVGVSKVDNKDPSAWVNAMHQADKSLYSAKSNGRNCVVFSPM